MKIVTASNGKKVLKMTRKEWENIGKKAGWEDVESLHELSQPLQEDEISDSKYDDYDGPRNSTKFPKRAIGIDSLNQAKVVAEKINKNIDKEETAKDVALLYRMTQDMRYGRPGAKLGRKVFVSRDRLNAICEYAHRLNKKFNEHSYEKGLNPVEDSQYLLEALLDIK